MKEKPETLETALKEMMRHIRCIGNLEQEIDEKWGVRLRAGFIYPPGSSMGCTADVNVQRGLEAVAEAVGKEVKTSAYSRYTRELRYYGIEFRQHADDRSKTFVKAGCQPPKVQIVEDDDENQ